MITRTFSILIGSKLGLSKIPILALVGDLAYIYDIWAINLDGDFSIELLREKSKSPYSK